MPSSRRKLKQCRELVTNLRLGTVLYADQAKTMARRERESEEVSRENILDKIREGPILLSELKEYFRTTSDPIVARLASPERDGVIGRLWDKRLSSDDCLYFAVGMRPQAKRRLIGLLNQKRQAVHTPMLVDRVTFSEKRRRKKRYAGDETGKVWENPENSPEWEPYRGQCPCENQWLEGFIWGGGERSAFRPSLS